MEINYTASRNEKFREGAIIMTPDDLPNIPSVEQIEGPCVEVQFFLLENFSLVSFTAAVDALMTANLIHPLLFSHRVIGVDSQTVRSDISIDIRADIQFSPALRHDKMSNNLRILIVCGGYRCTLLENPELSSYFRWADHQGALLCSLWNGSVHFAHAGLLNKKKCATHVENHAYFKEAFPQVELSPNSFVISENRASSTGPVSTIEMMFGIINGFKGGDIARATREILCCDKLPEIQDSTPLRLSAHGPLPTQLQAATQLMSNNIEEPLSLKDISRLLNISTRQIERLFQAHLETTPSKYYLKIRVNYAKQLLAQSELDVIDVALASGFVTASHFGNCFKRHYGISPRESRDAKTTRTKP